MVLATSEPITNGVKKATLLSSRFVLPLLLLLVWPTLGHAARRHLLVPRLIAHWIPPWLPHLSRHSRLLPWIALWPIARPTRRGITLLRSWNARGTGYAHPLWLLGYLRWRLLTRQIGRIRCHTEHRGEDISRHLALLVRSRRSTRATRHTDIFRTRGYARHSRPSLPRISRRARHSRPSLPHVARLSIGSTQPCR